MFKFRLQPVLRYREFLEEQKKMELAEKQRVYLSEKRRGDALREMRFKYHEAMRDETAQTDISVTKLSFYQSYIFVIEKQITRQDEKIREARKQMAKAQELLVEAKRQKEVLVKARERAYEKHLYAESMVTQKLMDDMGTVKYIRTNKGLDSSAIATRMR